MLELGMRLSLSRCVLVTSLYLCTTGNSGDECVLSTMFSYYCSSSPWNALNCINTNIFKVYEVSEESTTEEKVLVTHPPKTKIKIAKGI